MNANRNLRLMSKVFRFVTILAVLLMNLGGVFPVNHAGAQTPFSLHIRAYIDGGSHLVIQGDTVYWHHFGAAALGGQPGG